MTAIILIFTTVVVWATMSPAYEETIDWVDDEVNFTGSEEAEEAYETVKNTGNNVMRIIGPAFFLTYVIWAILKMSERERYTGVYR